MKAKTNHKRWMLCVLFILAAKQMVVAHIPPPDALDQATIIYVDDDADSLNVGTSWGNAINSLQDALLLAYFSDKPVEIRVAEGVYTPDRGLGIMPGDSSASFQLINGVTIKGGYAPNIGGHGFYVRDTNQYKSILSGDLNANDGPALTTIEENSFHVITSRENNATAVLDGFTISGSSFVSDRNPNKHSNGMYTYKSSPTLIDCNFTGNMAAERGAGMYNASSNPVLLNCTFNGNNAPKGGAGIYNFNSSPILTNCTFSWNTVGGSGAGMYNNNSSPTLLNCVFTSNYAGMNGGGMYNEKSYPTLTNCTFTDNSAGDDGGAIYSGFSDISLSDCIFEENRAEDDGGGLCHVNGNIHLTGCTFVDNSALPPNPTSHSNNSGGAMTISIFFGNKAVAIDCLFRNNSAVSGGAIHGDLTALRGCRFTGNVAYEKGGALDGRGTLTCEKCLFDGNKALVETAVAQCYGTLLFTNCTFVDNLSPDGNAFLAYGGHGSLTDNVFNNCIIWGGTHGLDPTRPWLQKTSVTYCDIQGGWPDEGNIDVDPSFADPGSWDPNETPDDPNDDFWIEGDYRLKSQAGRWDPAGESWVVDDITSPCIDVGDPNIPVAFEPFPNGGIINMGAYGGTVEASKSPSGIHAKYGGGSGTAENPYLIYTAKQMNTIGAEPNDWDKHFKLMANIDLSIYTGTDFNIIGYGLFPAFSGVFDGNDHTISNFTYSSTGESCIGIFGYVLGPNARIINVGMIDPNINGGTAVGVGSLAGWIDLGTVTNCYVIGGSVTGKQLVGGLIGSGAVITDCYAVGGRILAEGSAGCLVGRNGASMINCHATGSVTGSYRIGGLVGSNGGSIVDCNSLASVEGRDAVGGLVGYNYRGNITNCFSTSGVAGENSTGGLVGENRGSVINCYYSGTLDAQDHVGGLIGINDGIVTASYSSAGINGRNKIGGLVGYNTEDAEIVNCYANGDVIGQRYVGGLVGNNATIIPRPGLILPGMIRNCYSVTLVSGDQNVGGLIGHFGDEGVSGSFWDIEVSGQTTSDGGVGKTTYEMQTADTFLFAGWDFINETANGTEDIWWILEGQDYPRLW